MSTVTKPTKQQPNVKVRPETLRKIKRIAKAKRWTQIETVDALADEFLAKSGTEQRLEPAGSASV